MNNRQSQKGFTLIELMIVVIVMTLLLTIGVPAYQEQVRKTRRAEATNMLLRVAKDQERFFTRNNQYAADMTSLGYAADDFPTENGFYEIATSRTTAPPTFTITATAQGDQASDGCGNFSITSTGAKTVSGSLPAAKCW